MQIILVQTDEWSALDGSDGWRQSDRLLIGGSEFLSLTYFWLASKRHVFFGDAIPLCLSQIPGL
jgi:hypothetical protein